MRLQSVPAQASSIDEIKPLVELCKAGHLFDVQEWIKAGKPIDPPPARRANGRWSPLEFSMERGFHSLVQVFLEAGAAFGKFGSGSEMSRALRLRRFDIVKLLVDHGYDATSVDMREVFETWDGEIMQYFIDRGAEVEEGNPLAQALCQRIQTALRVLKGGLHRFPSFQRQADIALRYHCKEGNAKWVSLMLWAGADPNSEGSDDPNAGDSEEDPISALAFASLYQHFEIFDLKQLHVDVSHPSMQRVARYCCSKGGLSTLGALIDRGLKVNDQENGGCSLIHEMTDLMTLYDGQIEAIDLLVRRGTVKWVPRDNSEINTVRRYLLRKEPRVSIAFFSLMVEVKACSRRDMQTLISASMKKHLGPHAQLIGRFMSSLPETTTVATNPP